RRDDSGDRFAGPAGAGRAGRPQRRARVLRHAGTPEPGAGQRAHPSERRRLGRHRLDRKQGAIVTSPGIEIIGMISTTLASEIYGKSIITGAVDPRFIAEFAGVHEAGGFDRVLVGYGSTGADGFGVTAHAAAAPTRPGFLLAPPPAFVAPAPPAAHAPTPAHVAGGRRSPRAKPPRSIT